MVYILAKESRNKGEGQEIQQKVVPYARETPGGQWVRCRKVAWDMHEAQESSPEPCWWHGNAALNRG